MGVSYADSMKAWVLGLAAGFGLALGTTAAHAQLAVYGKFDLLHNSQDEDNSSIANNLQTTFFYGGGVGVYDDFFHVGPVHVGVDVRGDVLTGKYSNYRRCAGRGAGGGEDSVPVVPALCSGVGGGGRYARHEPAAEWHYEQLVRDEVYLCSLWRAGQADCAACGLPRDRSRGGAADFGLGRGGGFEAGAGVYQQWAGGSVLRGFLAMGAEDRQKQIPSG